MNGTPEEHAELIELEHDVATRIEDIKFYRKNSQDVNRQVTFNKMLIKLGQKANRLKELQKIVYGKEG